MLVIIVLYIILVIDTKFTSKVTDQLNVFVSTPDRPVINVVTLLLFNNAFQVPNESFRLPHQEK